MKRILVFQNFEIMRDCNDMKVYFKYLKLWQDEDETMYMHVQGLNKSESRMKCQSFNRRNRKYMRTYYTRGLERVFIQGFHQRYKLNNMDVVRFIINNWMHAHICMTIVIVG